jgi:hypothetical protein
VARHDKILQNKTTCPECDYKWNSDSFTSILFRKNQEQMNFVCYCKTRLIVKININGFLVMRRYIMKKEKVKRISK